MCRQLLPQQGQATSQAGVDARHSSHWAEEGVLLRLAGVVVRPALLGAANNLTGILLPGAPLQCEAGEAVAVQVAQLTVRHQPTVRPPWHCFRRLLVRISTPLPQWWFDSLSSYDILC